MPFDIILGGLYHLLLLLTRYFIIILYLADTIRKSHFSLHLSQGLCRIIIRLFCIVLDDRSIYALSFSSLATSSCNGFSTEITASPTAVFKISISFSIEFFDNILRCHIHTCTVDINQILHSGLLFTILKSVLPNL